jgi:hypothetical protein
MPRTRPSPAALKEIEDALRVLVAAVKRSGLEKFVQARRLFVFSHGGHSIIQRRIDSDPPRACVTGWASTARSIGLTITRESGGKRNARG